MTPLDDSPIEDEEIEFCMEDDDCIGEIKRCATATEFYMDNQIQTKQCIDKYLCNETIEMEEFGNQ